jgi:hypothetical protein
MSASRQRNVGSCSVEGCESPSRKRGWCASHYAQQRRTGRPPEPFKYKWGERTDCQVCGKPTDGFRLRRFCSTACDFLFRFYGGDVPSETACVACGVTIDLTARGKGGQRIKAHVKFCRRCRQDYDKYKMSAGELAARDGANCGICREPVDMSLTRADGLMCPSVDHIIPRARGGTHDADNLQLAHLRCNMLKSDRIEVA